jgi:hypothetical protein
MSRAGAVKVYDLAHCRAGDKGNTSNISVIAYDDGGGVTISLNQDVHGKSLSTMMLEIEFPGEIGLGLIG